MKLNHGPIVPVPVLKIFLKRRGGADFLKWAALVEWVVHLGEQDENPRQPFPVRAGVRAFSTLPPISPFPSSVSGSDSWFLSVLFQRLGSLIPVSPGHRKEEWWQRVWATLSAPGVPLSFVMSSRCPPRQCYCQRGLPSSGGCRREVPSIPSIGWSELRLRPALRKTGCR